MWLNGIPHASNTTLRGLLSCHAHKSTVCKLHAGDVAARSPLGRRSPRPLASVRPGDITFASILTSPCSCDRNIANKRRRVLCPEFYDGVSERGNLPGPSPHADPEQGHRLPSPIDQPALNVKAHSSRRGARSPPLAPSLAGICCLVTPLC